MKIIAGNVHEAAKYAKLALKWHGKCKMRADWYKKMADAHLGFNTDAKALIDAQLKAVAEDPATQAYSPGIMAAYAGWMEDVREDTAEVHALLAMLK